MIYLICTAPRSGSTLLSQGLSSTQMMGRPDEYFDNRPDVLLKRSKQWGLEREKYFNQVIEKTKTGNSICGIKLHWHQLDTFISEASNSFGLISSEEGVLSRIQENYGEIKFIFLTRRNKVAEGISLYKALATNTWRQKEIHRNINDNGLAFDIYKVSKCVRRVCQQEVEWINFFTRNSITPYHIFYEDFSRNYEATLREVAQFLGVDLTGVNIARPELVKQANERSVEWEARYRLARFLLKQKYRGSTLQAAQR